jgi:regulator of sigma E protease
MSLIAAITFAKVLVWTEVAIGLGLVIFVHELGHFLVAKLCGVKCEKFYLGFDIYGLKLLKFQWGETEYGIGILPLGGYVKMLGQEDNPTKAYEEMHRARRHEAPPPPVEGWAADRTEESEGVVYDPRSYLAQSVPKRMAIISAGVVMNLIFAFVLASVAYALGVEYNPCIISGLVPGQPAWRANLQVGDEIAAIGNLQKPRYSDLQSGVALGDLKHGVELTIHRDSQPPFEVVLRPSQEMGLPRIGIIPPLSLKLYDKRPVDRGTPAAQATPKLVGGDVIVAVDEESITRYAQLDRLLAQRRAQPLSIRVRRTTVNNNTSSRSDKGDRESEIVTTTLAPNPVRQFGLIMAMGPIVALQQNSPAEKAGFKAGERIVAIDGQEPGDPMTLPDRLYRRAGQRVVVSVRHGDDPPRDVTVVMPQPVDYEWPKIPIDNVPQAISGLGIAYRVLNRVEAVEPDSPAAKAGIKAGDAIRAAVVIPPRQDEEGESDLPPLKERTIEFSDEKFNWPCALGLVQQFPVGTQLKLKLETGREVTMAPVAASDWFNPERGLNLEPLFAKRQAESLREALILGGQETLDWTLQVYRFLQKIGHQVPITEMGGPVAIAATAGSAAQAGFTHLLIFLVMLSANLAVLNFLPIPMLDGGHMVFLILEGIRRKPVSEKVVLAFHYAGFLFIVTLMCFVLFLDVRRWLL